MRADCGVQSVAKEANGLLMATIAQKIEYRDADCINMFRDGAALVGLLPQSGLVSCTPIVHAAHSVHRCCQEMVCQHSQI